MPDRLRHREIEQPGRRAITHFSTEIERGP
jgi:hypothetical protein